MTTTISKHEVQQQQQQQQQQLAITTATTATATTATTEAMQTQFDTLNNNETAAVGVSLDDPESGQTLAQSKSLKRRSLLNFKSFDFHIKTLYSGLRAGHKSESASQSQSRSSLAAAGGVPHLRIEGVDPENPGNELEQESMDLLLDYGQSPFTPRHNSSTQLLPINKYSGSPALSSSLSPYFLSPYTAAGGAASSATAVDDCDSGNIRRSSTSDIVACRRRGSASAGNSRRPSTSDLLRRARERRGGDARMGRSVSHSAMRGGGGGGGGGLGGGGGCLGGRRTSMAF